MENDKKNEQTKIENNNDKVEDNILKDEKSINSINNENDDDIKNKGNNIIIDYNNKNNNINISDNIKNNNIKDYDIKNDNNKNLINNDIINENNNNLNNIDILEKTITYDSHKILQEPKCLDTSFSNINTYEHKNSIYSSYSGSHGHKKSIYSNYSGPYEHKNRLQSNYSISSDPYGISTNDSEYNYSCSISNLSFLERKSLEPSEKKFDINVDIKKVIYLDDRRTTLMIKNIPNKFTKDMLLNIIDKNFKGTYNLFILPTDVNKYKNFGYAFINLNSTYYIPYFYFLFNGKKWSNTNSIKICEITYSKIQGRNNLLMHYANKVVFRNDEFKFNPEQKYIIPNDYRIIFNKAFPNFNVEEYKYYFITKMPFKY